MSSSFKEHEIAENKISAIPSIIENSNILSISQLINSKKLFEFACESASGHKVLINDNDNCDFDRRRLENVVGFLAARKSLDGLFALYDHKGILHSFWKDKDSCIRGLIHVGDAWECFWEDKTNHEPYYYDDESKPAVLYTKTH